jgi:archaellum component FlaF (FlaF/FlaG flagellin family)
MEIKMKNSSKLKIFKNSLDKEFSIKKRRGLSTVVSTAILMSSMAIMGVMLVGWSNTNLFTQQAQMEDSFNTKINKLNENLMIENVWFGTSPNVVNVTMNNVGTVGLNVTSVQLVNSTDTLLFLYSDGGIDPSGDFSIQEAYNWNSGETVDFTITTNRGNHYVIQEVT